jgi:Fe-S cluster assembly iron-binding protein IscA
MITVTPLATEKLAAYLTENNIDSPVRITATSGCSGPSLGLALDERQDHDHAREEKGVTLLISRDLAQQCGTVTVDFIEAKSGCGCGDGGFSITSERALPGGGGCGGCGGSCSTGSCGS